MTLIFFICLGTLLVVLQTTLFMPSPAWAYAPDFFYIFIAYLASRFDVFRGILLVYLVGLMLDVLVGSVLGMYSLLCFLGYGLIRIVEQNLKRGSLLYSIPLISCSFLLLSGLVYLIFNFLYAGQLVSWNWIEIFIRTALVTLFTYPLFRLFDMLYAYAENMQPLWKRPRVRPDSQRRRQT